MRSLIGSCTCLTRCQEYSTKMGICNNTQSQSRVIRVLIVNLCMLLSEKYLFLLQLSNSKRNKEISKSIDCLRPPPGFVFFALCDWSRKIAPPSESVILKSWSSSRLGHLSFPRFKQFACSYSEFSLANHNLHICFNWSQLLLWI